jgi:hypothetical protein
MTWRNPSPLQLHHGTVDIHVPSILASIDVNRGRLSIDFSQGFYTTTNFRQARAHARNLLHRTKAAQYAVVLTYTLNRDHAAGLTSIAFTLPDVDYWDLVDWCRAGHPSHHATAYYEVAYGPVSNDRRRRTVWDGYDQVSFHSARAATLLGLPTQYRV